jgi:hypothetical protein
MAKVSIIDKREIPSADPQRVGKMDALITYQQDSFRTYLITLPNELLGGPNEDQVVADAIRVDLAERQRWAEKEIEV